MVDWITVTLSILGALIVAFLGPYYTHKFSIKYFKKQYFFKEKISIFEKMGGFSWKNHFVLSTIESLNKQELMDGKHKNLKKAQLGANIKEFTILMDKLIYFSPELRKNLGKYISLFEEYIDDKSFGEEERTKKLRNDCSPYINEVNKIIQKEIDEIK